MLFRYAGVIAINPNTDQTEIVKSATGTVHINEDWDTPVVVQDVNGFDMTTLNTTVEGLFSDFYIEDQPVVGFKTSSGHRFYLRSSTPVPGPAGPTPRQVTATGGNLVFEYEDGTTIPGPAMPTSEELADTEIADLVQNVESATGAALNTTFTPRADVSDIVDSAVRAAPALPSWGTGASPYIAGMYTYNLRPDNLAKWRAVRDNAARGTGQAHISTFLDSITYGANTATADPKYINAWPGRMARMMKAELGNGGTGVVPLWSTFENKAGSPTHDDRFKFAGQITSLNFGVYASSAKRVTGVDGSANYIEFTATCDEFVLYHLLSSGGSPRVQVDGGAIQTIAASANTSLAHTIPAQPGYWGEGAGTGQLVTRVPAGTLGRHTIRLMAPESTGTLILLGIEGRISGKGVRVSNLAQSGRAMSQMVMDDTRNHYHGMSVSLDLFRSDLAVYLLGMNDYQGHADLATFKSRVITAVNRQRDGGTYGAHGDVILATCPQPNYAAPIPGDGVLTPSLTDYYQALYEVADELDVPLIDTASAWRDYQTASANGYFADNLHPNNIGSEALARMVYNTLMGV